MTERRDGKAALYTRVSTEAQRDEGYSIEAQRQMLQAYCVSRGIKSWEFYTDGGFSGSNIDRPELQRMISDIKAGAVSVVAVYKLDRLSRSQKDTLYLIEDVLLPNNVSFISLNENMDTSTPIGRAMLGIMSAFAQLERETIRERTRIGMHERVKSGLWMGGGRVPFGYDYDRTRGILVPNDDAQTVRRIYSLYLQGYSALRIARMTGLKYERLASQILKRKSNTGSIVYRGEEIKNCHEPIISEEIYDRAMELMRKRSKNNIKTSKSLLSGLIYCGVCGAKMRYQKWSGGRYMIYCYSQDKSKTHLCRDENCDNVKTDASVLEQTVLDDLFSLKYDTEKGQTLAQDTMKLLEASRRQLEKKLSRLYALYAEDGDEVLRDSIASLKKELTRTVLQIEQENTDRRRSSAAADTLKRISALGAAWDTMTVAEKQTVLRELVDRIVITYDRVDIYYNENIR